MSDEPPAESGLCDYCNQFLTLVCSEPETTLEGEQDQYRDFPEHYELFGLLQDSAETCPVCADLLAATEQHIRAPRVWRESEATMGDEYGNYDLSISENHNDSGFSSTSALRAAGIAAGKVLIGIYPDDPSFLFLVRKASGIDSMQLVVLTKHRY